MSCIANMRALIGYVLLIIAVKILPEEEKHRTIDDLERFIKRAPRSAG
jgi:hypothetical protein